MSSERQEATPPPPLPLSEIALNAAIELDSQEEAPVGAHVWLHRLAMALNNSAITDLGLVPVYDRALHSADGAKIETKVDFYRKLRSFVDRLEQASEKNIIDREALRDFCLALHEGLINRGYQQQFAKLDNVRRYA